MIGSSFAAMGMQIMLAACAGFVFVVAVFTLLVRFATRLVAGFFPRYGSACLAWFLGWVAAYVGNITIIGFAMSFFGRHDGGGANYLIVAIALIVKPPIYSWILKGPEGRKMSIGKSLLVVLIELVVAALVFAAFLVACLAGSRPEM